MVQYKFVRFKFVESGKSNFMFIFTDLSRIETILKENYGFLKNDFNIGADKQDSVFRR